MKPRKCEKTGKIGYGRASDAKKTFGRVPRRFAGLAQAPKNIYRCQHCGDFHVTRWDTEMVRLRGDAVKRKGKPAIQPRGTNDGN